MKAPGNRHATHAVLLVLILAVLSPAWAADPRPKLPPPPEPSLPIPKFEPDRIPEIIEKQHEWSCYLVDSVLREERPPHGDPAARRLAAYCIDAMLGYASPTDAAASEQILKFYTRRIEMVAHELRRTRVTEGWTAWKLYGMGYIVRTPTVTMAFDLVCPGDAASGAMDAIADRCNVLFISNRESEHFDDSIVQRFLARGKKVIAVHDVLPGDPRVIHPIRNGGVSATVALPGGKIEVTAYPGRTKKSDNNFWIVRTDDGTMICHTGGQQRDRDFAWIDTVKNREDIDLMMVNASGAQTARMIEGVGPVVALTGLENLLYSDTQAPRTPHFLIQDRLQDLKPPYYIMAWGESFYHQPGQSYPCAASPRTGIVHPDDPRPLLGPASPVASVSADWTYRSDREYLRRLLRHVSFALDDYLRRCRDVSPPVPNKHRLGWAVLDEVTHYPYSASDDGLPELFTDVYLRRLKTVREEIEKTVVSDGAVVWRLYNMGYIIRTPSVTIAFDIAGVPSTSHPEIRALLEYIAREADLLFISHPHGDHYDEWFVELIAAQGKPVCRMWDTRWKLDGETPNSIDLLNGRRISFVAYEGYQHDTPNNLPIITTPESLVICHAGDMFQASTTPIIMDSWAQTIGEKHQIDLLIAREYPYEQGKPLKWIETFRPRVYLPGHDNEIGHSVEKRKPGWLLMERVRSFPRHPLTETLWGESFFYKPPDREPPPAQ